MYYKYNKQLFLCNNESIRKTALYSSPAMKKNGQSCVWQKHSVKRSLTFMKQFQILQPMDKSYLKTLRISNKQSINKDNPDGVEIDLKKLVITIHAQIVGKKSKQVTLGVIQFHLKQTVIKELEEVLLLKVIEVCNSKTELNSDLTKQLIQNMSVGLKILLEERKSTKERWLNMEAQVKFIEEQNKHLLTKLSDVSKIQNQKREQYESEIQEDLQLVEKALFKIFQYQWKDFIKNQNRELSKVQKIKNVIQIGLKISSDKLKSQYNRYDKKIKKLLPITVKNQDKYIDLMIKYKPRISKFLNFHLIPFTRKSKMNIQISIQSDMLQIQPLLIKSSKQAFDLLCKHKPSKQQAKQLLVDQTKLIKKIGKIIFLKIYKILPNKMQLAIIMQLFSTATYDHVRPHNANNNNINSNKSNNNINQSFNYYEFNLVLCLYQQELKQEIQEFRKIFETVAQEVIMQRS